jgi:hypothetical protein
MKNVKKTSVAMPRAGKAGIVKKVAPNQIRRHSSAGT